MIYTRLLVQCTYQSGAPSQRYWIDMHLPSSGHRNGSKAWHFVSVKNELSLQILDGFMLIIHELVLQDIRVCNYIT